MLQYRLCNCVLFYIGKCKLVNGSSDNLIFCQASATAVDDGGVDGCRKYIEKQHEFNFITHISDTNSHARTQTTKEHPPKILLLHGVMCVVFCSVVCEFVSYQKTGERECERTYQSKMFYTYGKAILD